MLACVLIGSVADLTLNHNEARVSARAWKQPNMEDHQPHINECFEAIEQALQDMAREGLIVDSGRREWNELTGRYDIVWIKKLTERRTS